MRRKTTAWIPRPCLYVLLLALIFLPASSAHANVREHLSRPDNFFAAPEARRIADNILSYQSPLGGWPKNTDTAAAPYTGRDKEKDLKPTFDDGATTDELRYLAHMFVATKEERFRTAVEKGIDYTLAAQYPTGGWPQFHPPGKQYHRHITFNDNSMVRVMEFLREVAESRRFGFVDDKRRAASRAAFDKGVECILKCQIKVNGRLTSWCAEHDEIDYLPRPARAFELVSLSGFESVGIVRLLMSIEKPSPGVIQSVDAAVAWLKSAELRGICVIEVPDQAAPKGKDKRVIDDPSAPPLWARFYDIQTNKPFFCDRDGVAKPKLSDIGHERRNGYAWYGEWPAKLIEKEYPAWKTRLGK